MQHKIYRPVDRTFGATAKFRFFPQSGYTTGVFFSDAYSFSRPNAVLFDTVKSILNHPPQINWREGESESLCATDFGF